MSKKVLTAYTNALYNKGRYLKVKELADGSITIELTHDDEDEHSYAVYEMQLERPDEDSPSVKITLREVV